MGQGGGGKSGWIVTVGSANWREGACPRGELGMDHQGKVERQISIRWISIPVTDLGFRTYLIFHEMGTMRVSLQNMTIGMTFCF